MLLFTSLPDDLDAERARLDVEEEQAQVLEALTPWLAQGLVTLTMPDDGRFATLQRLLREVQPHLLFLSGHGKFVQPPVREEEACATFLFEDAHGHGDLVPAAEIARAFVGSQVGCVVLSACESGMTSSHELSSGLSWQLNHAGIPYVIGMRESVLDVAGIQFAHHFCDAVARQEPVAVALQTARQAINTPLAGALKRFYDTAALAELSLGQWSLPMLIAPEIHRPLINWDFTPQPPTQQLRYQMLNQTLNTTVSLPPRFLGRRSELRTLNSRLHGDRGHTQRGHQLLITGPGGQGKTALAGKLAQDFETRGYQVLAWSARTRKSLD